MTISRAFRKALARFAITCGLWLWSTQAIAQEITLDEQAKSETISILSAPVPAPASHEGLVGPPAFQPQLPPGTPLEQIAREPAQPVTSLPEALERAYWTSPQLLAQRALTRSVDFRLPQARGQYGPQLQYSVGRNFQREYLQQSIGAPVTRTGWETTASTVLSLPLFTFGRTRSQENAAQAQIAFQRGSLLASEQDALLGAIEAYTAVLRDRAAAAITQSYVDLLSGEFMDIRTRLRARDTTIADVDQVETRLELARADLLTVQRTAASSEAAFLRAVGAPAGELAPPNPLVLPVESLEGAYVYADAHNPILAAAYARERVSRAQEDRARAETRPRVDLGVEGAVGPVSPFVSELDRTELRAGITISGTTDPGADARIREAAAANDSDWHLIDDALRQNRAEVAEAWNTWQGQNDAIARLKVAAESAMSAYEGASLQQRAGLRTTTEMLDLARDLLEVRSALNSAMAISFVQQARLLAAMGALRIGFLLPEAPIYDPEAHYDRVKNDADVPLLTPLIRALDSVITPDQTNRQIRDPAATVASGENR